MHLPPPVHGAAMAGNYIKTSSIINDQIDAVYVNLATNVKLNQSGKGSFKKIITFFRLIRRVLSELIRHKFDVCHMSLTASGLGFYKDVIIVALLKLFNVNIIYHFHNKGVSQFSQGRINNLLYKFVFRNTKSILLSRYLYPDIQSYVKEVDVYYCPYGIPETAVDLSKRAKTGPCILLYLSNMMLQKGVYVLVDAIKDLKKRGVSFECHFVGAWADIGEKDFERKILGANLSDVVFVHGPKYGNDKEDFLNKAEVFVFPTFYHFETFGIVNLEAMQHSLPIVSTPEGGISDIVMENETGFLVPQNDSKQLADKLEILIRNPELRIEMGIKGRERYQNLFTLARFETTLVKILKEAALSS